MWYTGTQRHVYIGRSLVIKFPKLRLKEVIGYFFQIFPCLIGWGDKKKYNFKTRLKSIKGYLVFAVTYFLYGFNENVNEARCYLRTKHPLLAKLYLPLIFMNIYRRENGVGNFSFKGGELFNIVSNSDDKEFSNAFIACSHTFDQRDNFSFCGSHVKILDYGQLGFENLLRNYGNRIENLLLSKASRTEDST